MTVLVIVESPAKCKKIESYLGPGYKCLASFGHIRQLGKGLECIDMDNNFTPKFVIATGKQKYISNIRKYMKNSDEVILATDDDREGEAIAWHLCKVLNLSISTTKRIIFHEITKPALQKAISNPIRVNMDMVNAQIARQVLDKLVGFTLSPILWKYISRNTKASLSAGRCQTPALRLVYDNQQEIDNSPGRKVYDTTGYFTKHNLEFKLNHSFKDEEKMADYLEESASWEHAYDVTKPKKVRKSPPKPFTTSTLQQKASNEFHYSPKQTMKLAQTLYENGYITYMRTDSAKYGKDFIQKAETFIEGKYGDEYISENISELVCGAKTTKKKKDNAQEAHEAIRPTDIERYELPDKIGPKEKKLYALILRNTVESCMATAVYNTITATTTAPEEYKYKFTSEQVVFPGWKIVNGYEKENPVYSYLLQLKKKQILPYKRIYSKLTLKDLKTHFTEARLVQQLEKKGIGRPSTFSSLISKIQERDYVKKGEIKGKKIKCIDFKLEGDEIDEIETERIFGNEKNKLILQPVGKMVIEFLLEHFDPLFVYEYTKQMEDELDIISKGKKVWHTLCKSCNDEMSNLSNNIKGEERSTIKIDAQHVYMIAKYGPVVKYQDGETTKFKSAKRDLDLDKLKRGEYTLEEVLEQKKETTNINLGKHKGNDVILKKGKYGLYLNWNGKLISAKAVNKTEKTIKLCDVVDLLEGKKSTNSNVLYEFDKTLSIRKGKYGPYIFFKTEKMKRPLFKNFKGKHWEKDFSSKDELREWIKEEHDI